MINPRKGVVLFHKNNPKNNKVLVRGIRFRLQVRKGSKRFNSMRFYSPTLRRVYNLKNELE